MGSEKEDEDFAVPPETNRGGARQISKEKERKERPQNS
jgi:hypothetical protein